MQPEKWPWGPPWNQLFLVDQVPNYSKKNQLRPKQSRENTIPQDWLLKDDAAPDTLSHAFFLDRDLGARLFRNNRRPRGQQTTLVAHSNRNSLKPRQYWSQKAIVSRRSASKTRCQRLKFLNVARETKFGARSRTCTQLSISGRAIGITAVRSHSSTTAGCGTQGLRCSAASGRVAHGRRLNRSFGHSLRNRTREEQNSKGEELHSDPSNSWADAWWSGQITPLDHWLVGRGLDSRETAKSSNSRDKNCGPLSVGISSGYPWQAKIEERWLMVLLAEVEERRPISM